MIIKFQLSLSLMDASFDRSKDSIFISGSSKKLGEWNVNQAIEMSQKSSCLGDTPAWLRNGSENGSLSLSTCSLSSMSSAEFLTDMPTYHNEKSVEFEVSIQFDDAEFENDAKTLKQNYKYLIAQKTSDKVLFIKEVEYSWRELNIEKKEGIVVISDKWPNVDVDNKLLRTDHGWLLNGEHEIQFHFYKTPLQLWLNNTKPLCLSILPWRTNSGLHALNDYAFNRLDFDENQILVNKVTQFNALNSKDVYSSFRIRTLENPLDLLFQINIHELEEDGRKNGKHLATTYFKVNKSLIDESLIECDLSLLDSNQIVGSLRCEILLITSLSQQSNYSLAKNYNYHFNRSCISIGHRGMGKTFDADTLPSTHFVENTIESFREAHKRGAQMVEFDIVLTKDKVPIVYHDFSCCINQSEENSNKYLTIAVNQLTYEEIKQNRIYSHKILKKAANSNRDEFTSKLMFPTLREMCEQLDPKLGFNIEIKYPNDLEDGSQECDDHVKWLNRNQYVDVILNELFECTKEDNGRCIIITTFDPNLCSMIRIKQNKFPVLFLTNGVTNKWVPYKDFRCKNTRRSLSYAKAEFLHGIVAHAEELTQNMHLINILFSHTSKSTNFWAYSWGDDLNEVEKRKAFYESGGINGIIYDRIEESHSS